MRFTVDKVALQQLFLCVCDFPLPIIISLPPPEVCDSPYQAAHYKFLTA